MLNGGTDGQTKVADTARGTGKKSACSLFNKSQATWL